jgi:ribosomal small subunit protein bTHX
MGRGDQRTRRGKIFSHSYGKLRPHHLKPAPGEAQPPTPPKVKPVRPPAPRPVT